MSSNVTTTGNEPVYNTRVVKQFALMTVVWGIVGMLVGVIIAAALVYVVFVLVATVLLWEYVAAPVFTN